ncbi:MAG: hypothetical protein ABFD16_31215, partial [Thermoguttaceae bacterium]
PFVGKVIVKRAWLTGETEDGTDGTGKYKLINSAESQEAEVIWFLRGRTLYRRVLLVLPNFDADLRDSTVQMQLDATPFYRNYDISVRNSDGGGALAANSLSDLTKPENRFAHRITANAPFHPHFVSGSPIVSSAWANLIDRTAAADDWTHMADPNHWAALGVPTLCECSSAGWIAGSRLPSPGAVTPGMFDAWLNPHPSSLQDPATGVLKAHIGPRIGEDVVLTNVISFDVKAWDPGAPVMMLTSNGPTLLPGDRGYLAAVRTYVNLSAADQVKPATWPRPISYGAYVDLNYLCQLGTASTTPEYALPYYADARNPANVLMFHSAGNTRSRVRGTNPPTSSGTGSNPSIRAAVYDTWSTHFEYDGADTDGTLGTDQGTNGFDDNNDGVVDDANEQEMPPPYAASLRGIQVRIRVFDPASRQIREVTVVQDFLPK